MFIYPDIYIGIAVRKMVKESEKNETNEKSGITTWAKEELEKINEQRRQALEQKGKFPFITIPEGVTELELLSEIPQKYTDQFGKERAGFIVIKDGEKYTWGVPVASSQYRQLINIIANGYLFTNGKTRIQVIRTGTGKNTRYSIKPI